MKIEQKTFNTKELEVHCYIFLAWITYTAVSGQNNITMISMNWENEVKREWIPKEIEYHAFGDDTNVELRDYVR